MVLYLFQHFYLTCRFFAHGMSIQFVFYLIKGATIFLYLYSLLLNLLDYLFYDSAYEHSLLTVHFNMLVYHLLYKYESRSISRVNFCEMAP